MYLHSQMIEVITTHQQLFLALNYFFSARKKKKRLWNHFALKSVPEITES